MAEQEVSSDFVSKLYQMLETPEYQGIVGWNTKDSSFLIYDTTAFQQAVIPQVFNHSNFSSFVRQLNKYDFHKLRFRDPHSKIWEFQHPEFSPLNRDKPFLIRRKTAQSRKNIANEAFDELTRQVESLMERQEAMEADQRHLMKLVRQQGQVIQRLMQGPNRPMLSPGNGDEQMVVNQSVGPNSADLHTSPRGGRFLLAMDDPEGRHICAQFVRDYGCPCDEVVNGLEVVRQAESADYDCIILDLVLSALDGLSATELIRQSNPTIPIILCIEEPAAAQHMEGYLQRGVTAVLRRPFTRTNLYNEFRRLGR